jgi:hypothetical protein
MGLLRRASLFVLRSALAGCIGISLLASVPSAYAGYQLIPFDVNQDSDVDQEDFGVFQACLSGPDDPPPAGCESLDINLDTHIDDYDLAVFAFCMSGPGFAADPACVDYRPPDPPAIVSADSQRFHPYFGVGRIDLISGTNTESRLGGPTEIHIVFDQDIAPLRPEWWQQIDSSYPPSNIQWSPRWLTISYIGIPDCSCLRIALSGITAADDPLAIISVRDLQIAVLCGDGNNDSVVTSLDESPPPILPSWLLFRYDYDYNGLPNVMDAMIARDRAGNTASCAAIP